MAVILPCHHCLHQTRGDSVAANSEFATLPYGPEGLKWVYGDDAKITPVKDPGHPTDR